MGKNRCTDKTYDAAVKKTVGDRRERVTHAAEQKARETGKLHPLVDPAGYGVIRRSLMRFEQQTNGLQLVTVGTPVPVEDRVDTTGSMDKNVDVAMRVMSHSYRLISQMLPGCDLQVATGIFGDRDDPFILCRPQFEMEAAKIVGQLALMVPCREGGDIPEDPHYGLFGAAYLTADYLSRIDLKGYDFTTTDAPARETLEKRLLERVFGPEVFEKAAENGHQIDPQRLPTTKAVVRDLLKRAHAFLLMVGDSAETRNFWTRIYGNERVIVLPSTELLPQVRAAIVGLTEGTLSLDGIVPFLTCNKVDRSDAALVAKSVANIPIGAQTLAENFGRLPKAGDLFRSKTDLWPMTAEELDAFAAKKGKNASPGSDKAKDRAPDDDWL